MKRILFILLFAMCASTGFAQDLIVTTAGDSIFCKITRESKGYVHFSYNKDGAPTNTLIANDAIANKQKGLYKTQVKYVGKESFARWQYRLQGGYSRRIARVNDQVSPSLRSYLNKIKSGYTVGGDIHYFISEPLGFGVKYAHNAYQYTETGFEDRVKLNYFALSALNRLILRSENEILLGVNMGYQSYADRLNSSGTEFKIDGGTIGLGLEVGYAIKLANASKAFVNLSLLSGTITKINLETVGRKETIKLDKEQFEGLGRIEVTLGLLFGK